MNLDNKKILIVGGTGSWGQALTRQILDQYNPKSINILSRCEQKQVDMERQFNNKLLKFHIGDIRDKDRLLEVMGDIDIVFHLAALKHVPICETHINETVKTNILGTQNLIDVAKYYNIKKFILISTDKAVDPINTYGLSKALAERIVINAGYICIRAGNVLGTSGSVVPLFYKLAKGGHPITVTDPYMTRFSMYLNDAINLIFKALQSAQSGEVYVMKMDSYLLKDLAELYSEKYKVPINIIGTRAGEKKHEILVSKYEFGRAEDDETFFKIKSMTSKNQSTSTQSFQSNTTNIIPKNELKQLLEEGGWL